MQKSEIVSFTIKGTKRKENDKFVWFFGHEL